MTSWSERLKRNQDALRQMDSQAKVSRNQLQTLDKTIKVSETDAIFEPLGVRDILEEVRRDVWKEGTIDYTENGNGLALTTEIPQLYFIREEYYRIVRKTFNTGASGGGPPITEGVNTRFLKPVAVRKENTQTILSITYEPNEVSPNFPNKKPVIVIRDFPTFDSRRNPDVKLYLIPFEARQIPFSDSDKTLALFGGYSVSVDMKVLDPTNTTAPLLFERYVIEITQHREEIKSLPSQMRRFADTLYSQTPPEYIK